MPRAMLSGGMLSAGRPAMYVVAAGDTTSGIANRLKVSVPALLAANHSRPRLQLRSGQWVFATLTEGEKLNVPRGSSVGLAGTPSALSAGPGEACGYTDWCVDGYHCKNGVCVPECPPGFMLQFGSCVAIGDNPDVGNLKVGVAVSNVVCPGPNMRLWDSQCICEDGFTRDPNGPGCVPLGVPGTYVPGSQEFREDCMEIGGEIDPNTGACRPAGGLYYPGSWRFKEDCIDGGGEIDPITGACRAKAGTSDRTGASGTMTAWDEDVQVKKPIGAGARIGAGAGSGGGTAAGKTGATTSTSRTTVELVDTKTGLFGSLSSGAKTALIVGGGLLAVGAAGGAYAYARRKAAKDDPTQK